MEKEKKTITAMIQLYCKEIHHSSELCEDCRELHSYAMKRLENCPYKKDKPACSKCTTHCYKPEMRERVKKVMRYSGPRMILHHPILAVDHLVKTFK
jgi:Nitrous oxide-stimulated promoter